MTIKSALSMMSVLLLCAHSVCLAQGNAGVQQPTNIVLSPADQLILQSINKINDRLDQMNSELNGRIDQINGRFDQVNQRMDQMKSELNGRMDQMNRELNGRMDQMNRELSGRIDNLWLAVIWGFIGVMGFIGGLVFWDRRTFMNRAREGMRLEMAHDRKRIDGLVAAMKTLSEEFPRARETLAGFGLL